jgi:uncharacterized SAM-dependent methyltransferase
MNVEQALLEKIDGQEPKLRDSTRVWYVNDSKLWYLTDEQADGYLAVSESDEYKTGMHDAETDLIERNLERIVTKLDDDVRALDLGCGKALKTIQVLAEAQNRGKNVVFYPVDISEKILDIAVRNAEEAGLETYGLQEDFEKFGQLLSKTKSARQTFVYLGANFVNFDSDLILSSIQDNMKEDDLIYFSAQISERDSQEIIAQYNTPEIGDFLFQTVKPLGLSSEDVSYSVRFNPDMREVETYFTIRNLPEKLKKSKLKIGDEIVVATSYKPTLQEFSAISKKYFTGELLFNGPRNYVGFLGHLKQ